MTAKEARELQHGLNVFTVKYLDGLGPILVDGKMGHSTLSRIRTVKYYLGYSGAIAQQNAQANKEFLERMWHPKDLRYSTAIRISRGVKRRIAQRRRAKQNNKSAVKNGIGKFDGISVAAIAIPHLTWARAHGWQGRLVSGWRDPNYSQSLCYRMCGRPSCPGMCAGLASNHVGSTAARFAIDVSDYTRFGNLMRSCPCRPRIWNSLPSDRVHFSPSGN